MSNEDQEDMELQALKVVIKKTSIEFLVYTKVLIDKELQRRCALEFRKKNT